jgi:hypothetical protein
MLDETLETKKDMHIRHLFIGSSVGMVMPDPDWWEDLEENSEDPVPEQPEVELPTPKYVSLVERKLSIKVFQDCTTRLLDQFATSLRSLHVGSTSTYGVVLHVDDIPARFPLLTDLSLFLQLNIKTPDWIAGETFSALLRVRLPATPSWESTGCLPLKTLPKVLPSLTHVCVSGFNSPEPNDLVKLLAISPTSIQRVLVELPVIQYDGECGTGAMEEEEDHESCVHLANDEPRLTVVDTKRNPITDFCLLNDWLSRVEGGEGCWIACS